MSEPSEPTDTVTSRLIHDEISERAKRLDASTARIDTKATALLGFTLALATFLAAQKVSMYWKIPAFVAFAVAAYYGVHSMMPRKFSDAPEPRPLQRDVGRRTELAALLLLTEAKINSFEQNRETHKGKVKCWRRSLVALTVAIILSVLALGIGSVNGSGGTIERPVEQPASTPSASPTN